MSKQTQFHTYIDGGTVVVAGPIAITFPTTLVAKTQQGNGTVTLAAGDQIVVAADANRKFAQIVNLSGVTQYIAFGNVASAASFPLPNNGVYTVDSSTIGGINQQAIHIFSTLGAADVQYYYE